MSPPSNDDKKSISVLQENSLLERLAMANRRIVELERSERVLSLQREKLVAMASAEIESIVRQPNEVELWPASRLDTLMNSLTIIQRRDAWLSALTNAGVSGSAYTLFPHDGKDIDPITILVRGSGGFGDMLYLSLVARLLFLRFDRARIVVMHEHPDAEQVFASNPYIVSTLCLRGRENFELLQAAAALDIFDLIADVRYVISYATPPLSRIPMEFLTVAHSRAAKWQRFVRREWPYLNNLLAREATARGMSKYDLVGYTGNLPISSQDAGDFFPTEQLPQGIMAELALPYVTLHHGADRFMSGHDGLSTKNLPDATWEDVVARCRAAGIRTIQVGEEREPLVRGVDLDLRGKTTFSQTGTVLKFATAHLDTEGGLVHLARSMGTTSVVAFGPTPVSFFGYEGNVNLEPRECGDCWWVSHEWARRCPRGMEKPACMVSHSSSAIAQIAIALVKNPKAVEIGGSLIDESSLYALFHRATENQASKVDEPSNGGLVILDNRDDLAHQLEKLCPQGLQFRLAVPDTLFQEATDATAFLEVIPFISGHIPTTTNSYDWALLSLKESSSSRVEIIQDAIRVLKPGAVAFILSIQGSLTPASIDLQQQQQQAKESLTAEATDLQRQLLGLPGVKLSVTTGSFTVRYETDNSLLECLILKVGQEPELAEGVGLNSHPSGGQPDGTI